MAIRKSLYKASGPQEAFIVPLLDSEITSGLILIHNQLQSRNIQCNSVLDCGCGNQPFRKQLENLGFVYESLDIEQNSTNNVDYLCGLDAPTSVFDAVIKKKYSLVLLTEVLEHVSGLSQAFRNAYFCTLPGGLILLTTPFVYPLHEEPHDYSRLTIHLIQKLATDVGFEIISLKKAGTAAHVMGTILGAGTLRLDSPSSICDKVINRFLLTSQRILFRCLLHSHDRIVSTSSNLYLANIAILRKPISGDHDDTDDPEPWRS